LYEVGARRPSNHEGCDILPATKNHDSVHIADRLEDTLEDVLKENQELMFFTMNRNTGGKIID